MDNIKDETSMDGGQLKQGIAKRGEGINLHPARNDDGVTWSPKHGAVCPACGREKTPTNTTRRWDGAYRVRYHRCPQCGLRFKSIETDYTLVSQD